MKMHYYQCLKNARIRNYSGPYNQSVSLGIQWKIRTTITPNTDTFYAVYKLYTLLSWSLWSGTGLLPSEEEIRKLAGPLNKKWSFPLRISTVSVTKSAGNFFVQWNYYKLSYYYKVGCDRDHACPSWIGGREEVILNIKLTLEDSVLCSNFSR